MATPKKPQEVNPAEILAELERIRASDVFTGSPRTLRFLEFVVEETLAGRADGIKQYTVAVDGLGSDEDFDPGTNPKVRIMARRVRRALKDYYTEEGADDSVLIEIPKGTYAPKFALKHKSEKGASERIAGNGDEPRIVVLPFSFLGEDAGAEHLAAGITAELTNGLTAFHGLEVVGRHSAAHYVGDRAQIHQMGTDLGVKFVLLGSVQKSERTIKVASQLVETETSRVLWAASWERELSAAGLYEIMDGVSAEIATTIGDYHGVIPRELVRTAQRKRTDKLTAYDATLLFHAYIASVSYEAYTRTREAVEQAVEMDPLYALGWAQLAELHCDAYASWNEPAGWPDNALMCAGRALALDSLSQEAWNVLAYVHFLNREHESAIRDAEASVRLNPKSAFEVAWAGWLIGLSGQLERGQQLIDDMERLNPYQPGWLRAVSLLIHLEKGDYQACLHEACGLGLPDHPIDILMRAAAAGLAGNEAVAIAACRELRKKFPEVAAEPAKTVAFWFHFDRWVEPMLEGLDKAIGMTRAAGPGLVSVS